MGNGKGGMMSRNLTPPLGLSHLVIHVRDMEASHRFWTEVVGLKMVGQRRPTGDETTVLNMRFYVGDRGADTNHHDLALVEAPAYPEPAAGLPPSAIHHIAIAFPDRQTWLDRLAYLQNLGVPFERRLEHGMTHSLYIRDPNGHGVELLYDMPRDVWEGDVEAALNYLVEKPVSGAAALEDRTEVPVFKSE